MLMLLSVCDVFLIVRSRRRTVAGTSPASEETTNRQKNIHKQMFVLILASVAIFFLTNLPIAIGRIIFPQSNGLIADPVSISTIWTGFSWFQSFNYAVSRSSDGRGVTGKMFVVLFRSISTFIASRRTSFEMNSNRQSNAANVSVKG